MYFYSFMHFYSQATITELLERQFQATIPEYQSTTHISKNVQMCKYSKMHIFYVCVVDWYSGMIARNCLSSNSVMVLELH